MSRSHKGPRCQWPGCRTIAATEVKWGVRMPYRKLCKLHRNKFRTIRSMGVLDRIEWGSPR